MEAFGVTADDLQSNIVINGTKVTGTLKNITDGSVWDSGTWGASESTGHFIFVKVEDVPEGATVAVHLINGVHGPQTLDSDQNIIIRITDPGYQKIRVVTTLGSFTDSKVYSLTGLTLA